MRFRLAAVINSVAAHGHRGDLRIRSGTSVPRRTVERCPARYVGAATRGPRTSTIAPALIARCAPQGNASSTAARGRPGGGPSFPRASAGIARQATRQISHSSTPLTCTDTDGGPFGPCDPTGPSTSKAPAAYQVALTVISGPTATMDACVTPAVVDMTVLLISTTGPDRTVASAKLGTAAATGRMAR
jgi:hypothetical protein